MELCVINPGAVLGPVRHYSTSGLIYRVFLGGTSRPAHRCELKGRQIRRSAQRPIQRFCCAIEFGWIDEVAEILAKRFGPEGWKIPTRKLPNFMVRIVAMFDPTVKTVVSDLGRVRNVSNDRIRRVLNWQPHSLEEMAVSMGETMIQQGIVSR